MLHDLMTGTTLTAEQQDWVLDALPALTPAQTAQVYSDLVEFTSDAWWTPRTARLLRRAPELEHRTKAWTAAARASGDPGPKAPPSEMVDAHEWSTAAAVETDPHVRHLLLKAAPLRVDRTPAGRAALEALVDPTTLTPGSMRPSAYVAWTLEHLPARLAWVVELALPHLGAVAGVGDGSADKPGAGQSAAAGEGAASKAAAWLLTRDLVGVDVAAVVADDRAPVLYRLLVAANISVPPGHVATALQAVRGAAAAGLVNLTGSEVLQVTSNVQDVLLDVPVGRAGDRDALLAFLDEHLGVPADTKRGRESAARTRLEAEGGASALVLDVLECVPRLVPAERQVEMLWRRLPVADRTDAVCGTLVRKSPLQASHAIAHLGERALEVLTAEGLVERATLRPKAVRWLLDVDPHRWVREVRELTAQQVPGALSADVPGQGLRASTRAEAAARVAGAQRARQLVRADLVENPHEWPEEVAVAAARHLVRFGDLTGEDYRSLPARLVSRLAAKGDRAAEAVLWDALHDVTTPENHDQPRQPGQPGERRELPAGSAVGLPGTRVLAVDAMLRAGVTVAGVAAARHI